LYYFFFSLLLLTGLAPLVAFLSLSGVRLLLGLSLAALAVAPWLAARGQAPAVLAAYWNPLNFLPYLFAARLLAELTGLPRRALYQRALTMNP
jgi:hypothetical protein